MLNQSFVKLVAVLATVTFGLSGLVQTASAGVVGTRTVMLQAERADSLARVHAALDREAVQQQLVSYGVDVEAAKARIASLSDAELRQLDGRLATLPAGAGIIEIVGVVFVVLLILELVGVIDIFKAF